MNNKDIFLNCTFRSSKLLLAADYSKYIPQTIGTLSIAIALTHNSSHFPYYMIGYVSFFLLVILLPLWSYYANIFTFNATCITHTIGLLTPEKRKISWESVSSITFHQPLRMRLFGLGNLSIQQNGTHNNTISILGIRPQNAQAIISYANYKQRTLDGEKTITNKEIYSASLLTLLVHTSLSGYIILAGATGLGFLFEILNTLNMRISLTYWFSRQPLEGRIVAAALMLILVSILFTLAKLANYRILEDHNHIKIKAGIVDKNERVISKESIFAINISSNILERVFRLSTVNVINKDSHGGITKNLILPSAPQYFVEKFIKTYFPSYDVSDHGYPKEKHSGGKTRTRSVIVLATIACILVIESVALPFIHAPFALRVILIVTTFFLCLKSVHPFFQSLTLSDDKKILATHYCLLSSSTLFITTQSITHTKMMRFMNMRRALIKISYFAGKKYSRYSINRNFFTNESNRRERPTMIEVHNLTKLYGKKLVLDDISFTVDNGSVTGFVGPNGAGKSTTMKIICGLEKPDDGTALVDGHSFSQSTVPAKTLGVHFSGEVLPSSVSALTLMEHAARLACTDLSRAKMLLQLVELWDHKDKSVNTFSMGMRQRLGMALSLIGDPTNLMLDEPLNGLDPHGILWMRDFIKSLAAHGKAVLLSSHLMSELSLVADHVIMLDKGKIISNKSMDDIQHNSVESVELQTNHVGEVYNLLISLGYTTEHIAPDTLRINDSDSEKIAYTVITHGLSLYSLTPIKHTLEQTFIDLTQQEGR